MTAEQEREAVVRFMREAIARGYPQSTSGKCGHGRYYFEDCIACYDDYLEGVISAIEAGEHIKETTA